MEDKLNIESKEREGPSNGSIQAKVMVFLERDKGGDLFIHFASVSEMDRKFLKENTRVSYVVSHGSKGPQANQIKII